MKPPIFPTQGHERCPFLGLHDDPKTALAYPSPWNCCYRANPHAAVSVPQQISTCLNRNHRQCPVFLAANPLGLPKELRGTSLPIKRKIAPKLRWFRTLTFITFISVAVFLGFIFFLQPISPFITSTPFIAPLPNKTESPQPPSASAQPFVIPSPDNNSQPTGDSSVVCGHSLDIPFGSGPQFIIHRVKSGENINGYADEYETTVHAILSINHEIRVPIWENTMVVIPVGTTLVVGLPPFEVYEIPNTTISLADLTQTLNTDIPSFLQYNAFDESCHIFSGWLLIPR